MPVNPLPPNPSLDDLEHQAKDVMDDHAARDPAAAQRIREFLPRFSNATDDEIFNARFGLTDAQLTIARESGFESWARLKRRVEEPVLTDNLQLAHHERIGDAAFRRAVDLLDAGDADGLRRLLEENPGLIRQRVDFEGGNYFRNPSLLEFVAENPIRRGSLPANIVEIATVILEAGAKEDRAAMDETLGLVSSGCVPRECGAQLPLIDLLCRYGADPDSALLTALSHGEMDAARALLQNGARITLPVAAALGLVEESRDLLGSATSQDRHRALAMAAQLGRLDIVRLLLDAGENPNRYNLPGSHSHSTPLHQAAFAGHFHVVRLLVERGARLDLRDTIWRGTPADWAKHGGRMEIEQYLRARELL